MRTSPRPSASDAVVADSVARRFAKRWALRGITLRVQAGEVIAIRGSNGSGKSTLLRIVASALRPTRGTCTVFGHDVVSSARDVRGLVGLLAHAPALYEDLTVTENLRFAERMIGLPDDAQRVERIIDTVSLGHAAHERARTLSSGMQRRVALARVMMQGPRLLLLDEPYNSLDADGVELVNTLIGETRDAGGATLLVSHEPERVAHLADRVLSMDAGLLRDAEAEERVSSARSIPFLPSRMPREAAR